jgi:hypothetical protein
VGTSTDQKFSDAVVVEGHQKTCVVEVVGHAALGGTFGASGQHQVDRAMLGHQQFCREVSGSDVEEAHGTDVSYVTRRIKHRGYK